MSEISQQQCENNSFRVDTLHQLTAKPHTHSNTIQFQFQNIQLNSFLHFTKKTTCKVLYIFTQ